MTIKNNNVQTFCAFLLEKFFEGRKYEQVDFTAVNDRIDRHNLTLAEEQAVHKFVQAERTKLFTTHLLAKRTRPQWVRAALQKLSLVMAMRNSDSLAM